MLGSLTVLPALLSRLGDKVDKVRFRRRRGNGDQGRLWGWIVDRVLRRPALSATLAGGLLLLLALPAIQMRMADASPGHVPGEARGRQDLQADAAGVPRDGAARQRDRQGAGRERAARPRTRSRSSSDGHSPADVRTSRSRSPSTTPARSRTSRSRSRATAATRRRTPRCGCSAKRSSRRPWARSRTRRPASPG